MKTVKYIGSTPSVTTVDAANGAQYVMKSGEVHSLPDDFAERLLAEQPQNFTVPKTPELKEKKV